MKNSIFEKKFDDIFTPYRLSTELTRLRPQPHDIELVREEIENHQFFGDAPKQTFFIPKSNGTFRKVSISSTKTKIIQRILATELGNVMDFNDKSYAFRRGKSPYKAIMRVRDLLRRYEYVAKADIESFFDTIDHRILIQKLKKIIKDPQIIHLIAYYLSQGSLEKNRWIDKTEGIYQGDVLSPLLSNIYLNDFDYYLEAKGVTFVRYSDDILFLGDSREQVSWARRLANEYLSRIGLRFNVNKTYLSDIDRGFEYLGISFVGSSMRMDGTRLSKKIEKLKKETEKLSIEESVTKLNQKIVGFKNYYEKIIDDHSQMQRLQNALDEIIIQKIIQAKTSKKVNNKAELRAILTDLKSYDEVNHKRWIEELISQAYQELALQTPLIAAQKRVASEKNSYLQHQIKSSEIVVSEVGAFLGFSQGKIKVKAKGQLVLEAPINRIKRILLLNKQSSLSSYLIYECAKRKIDIDFIERSRPYAMLTYYHHVSPQLHMTQLKNYFSPIGLLYAKEVVDTKSKNQINLMKYLNRRRKNPTIKKKIETMQNLNSRIARQKDKKALMGLEGSISVQYWGAFGEVLGMSGFTRTHQNSKDEINQALNYGYAILYSRVQSALIHEGLNLYYPLYHSIQPNKPTLVYDVVEAFRQPIVDREILSILNKGQKLTQSNGRLTKESIKLIVQHIQVRLATPAHSRYGKSPLCNIIGFQMNHLKRSMLDHTTYKGFVNKY